MIQQTNYVYTYTTIMKKKTQLWELRRRYTVTVSCKRMVALSCWWTKEVGLNRQTGAPKCFIHKDERYLNRVEALVRVCHRGWVWLRQQVNYPLLQFINTLRNFQCISWYFVDNTYHATSLHMFATPHPIPLHTLPPTIHTTTPHNHTSPHTTKNSHTLKTLSIRTPQNCFRSSHLLIIMRENLQNLTSEVIIWWELAPRRGPPRRHGACARLAKHNEQTTENVI